MKIICLCLCLCSVAQNANGQATQTPDSPSLIGKMPILIDLQIINGKTQIMLNGQVMTVEGLGAWFQMAAKTFGTTDAVVIRFGRKASAETMLQLRTLVMKTHQNVRLILDERREGVALMEFSISDVEPSLFRTGPQSVPRESDK